MSEDSCICHKSGGCHWHPVGRGEGCGRTSYRAQDSPNAKKDPAQDGRRENTALAKVTWGGVLPPLTAGVMPAPLLGLTSCHGHWPTDVRVLPGGTSEVPDRGSKRHWHVPTQPLHARAPGLEGLGGDSKRRRCANTGDSRSPGSDAPSQVCCQRLRGEAPPAAARPQSLPLTLSSLTHP